MTRLSDSIFFASGFKLLFALGSIKSQHPAICNKKKGKGKDREKERRISPLFLDPGTSILKLLAEMGRRFLEEEESGERRGDENVGSFRTRRICRLPPAVDKSSPARCLSALKGSLHTPWSVSSTLSKWSVFFDNDDVDYMARMDGGYVEVRLLASSTSLAFSLFLSMKALLFSKCSRSPAGFSFLFYAGRSTEIAPTSQDVLFRSDQVESCRLPQLSSSLKTSYFSC